MSSDGVEIIQRIAIFMPTFLFALVVHEYGHAWMATRFGDNTSAWSGRLTLNPMAHIDLFGTILFPLFSIVMGTNIFFGWAKPVPINPNKFSNYRKGLFWVAFAGPLANIILGFLTSFALIAWVVFVPKSFEFHAPMVEMLNTLLSINFSLAVFNLIPLPPLDGSNMLLSFLGYEATQKYLMIQQYSFAIMIFLMLSNVLQYIAIPIQILRMLSLNGAGMIIGLFVPISL